MSNLDRVIPLGAALCGIAMVVLSVWMLTRYPATAELTDGYRTPVLAFEFAQTPADLAFMTGDSDSAVRHRAAMAAGQQLDTAFPVAYAGLIVFLLLGQARRGRKLAWAGALIGILIVPADWQENAVMAAVLNALSAGDPVEPLLPALWTATWLKWGAIAVAMATLGLGALRERQCISGGLALLAAILIAATAALGAPGWLAEGMMVGLSLSLLGLVVGAGVRLRLRGRRLDNALKG